MYIISLQHTVASVAQTMQRRLCLYMALSVHDIIIQATSAPVYKVLWFQSKAAKGLSFI